MKISEIITDKYKLRIPPTVYYDLLADVVEVEDEQEPKTGYISIDDVMSVFDDFMCGEVDEDGTETFLEMLKDKADRSEEE